MNWENVTTQDVHTIPVGDLVTHDADRSCWCDPLFLLPCPERCAAGCWWCEEGSIPVGRDHPGVIQVVHRAVDGRP